MLRFVELVFVELVMVVNRCGHSFAFVPSLQTVGTSNRKSASTIFIPSCHFPRDDEVLFSSA